MMAIPIFVAFIVSLICAAALGGAMQRYRDCSVERYAGDVRWMTFFLMVITSTTCGLILSALGVL